MSSNSLPNQRLRVRGVGQGRFCLRPFLNQFSQGLRAGVVFGLDFVEGGCLFRQSLFRRFQRGRSFVFDFLIGGELLLRRLDCVLGILQICLGHLHHARQMVHLSSLAKVALQRGDRIRLGQVPDFSRAIRADATRTGRRRAATPIDDTASP